MRQKVTGGYAGRLKWALEHGPKPMSVRRLADRMKNSELRGATYGGIRQYAEDKVRNPRIELLRAISEVLEVRWEWLAYDSGPMTEDELRERGEVAELAKDTMSEAEVTVARRENKRVVDLKLRFLHAMGVIPYKLDIARLPHGDLDSPEKVDQWVANRKQAINLLHAPHWLPSLEEVRRRYGSDASIELFGRALGATLEALGMDPHDGVDDAFRVEDWLNDYITAMVGVLLMLAPERARQRGSRQG